MQRLGTQFKGARFENMASKSPGIYLSAASGFHESQVWTAKVPTDTERGRKSQL